MRDEALATVDIASVSPIVQRPAWPELDLTGEVPPHDSDDGQQHRQEDAADDPAVQALLEARFDHRLRGISDMVGRVCGFSAELGSWSARIPVDDELLPSTVLQLSYSPVQVTLHFETSDWGVREMLRPRTAALECLIQALLPTCAVAVTVQ